MLACATVLSGFTLSPLSARAQTPAFNFHDSGQLRSFEFASDEVEIFQRGESHGGKLKQILENQVVGSKVIQDSTSHVVVKVEGGYDPARIAAGTDSFRKALPGSEVSPVLYLAGAPKDQWSRRIGTNEILVYLPDGKTAADFAQQTGAQAIIPTTISNVARLKYQTPFLALDAAKSLAAAGVQVQPLFKRMAERMAANLPTDQFFPLQWHLVNTGQNGATPGFDINVLPVWGIEKGQGVIVGILDDCLEITHPDLRDNCPPVSFRFHHDFNDQDDDPSPVFANGDGHGTCVGGLVGARQNNGQPDPITGKRLGVSGVAPEATLYGLRLISGFFTDADVADAFTWAPGGTSLDVSSNSWGFTNRLALGGLDVLGKAALHDAATKGRNGRGQVTVFAAGNARFIDGNSNRSSTANSRYVVCVAALNSTGVFSSYSSPGSCNLVCAPGGEFGFFGPDLRITTTDVTGVGGFNPGPGDLTNTDYTSSMNGTSAATPITSGVVALMLKANPQLGWRDVKEILASTARRVDAANPGWVMRPPGNLRFPDPDASFNEAGFKFNDDYGSGLVDAFAAVARSLTWKNLPTEVVQTVNRQEPPTKSPIDDTGTPLVRKFDFVGATFPNLRVEQIEVEVKISTASRSDLAISVTSPSGVTSILTPSYDPFLPTGDTNQDYKDTAVNAFDQQTEHDSGWVFSTTHDWGENSQGTWTLTIQDQSQNGVVGSLEFSSIRLYGTAAGQQRVVFDKQHSAVSEPLTGTLDVPLTIRRLGPTTGSFSVDYATTISTATAGADYQNLNGTVTFADGEVSKDITLTILSDAIPEDLESVNVVLSNLQGPDVANVAFGGTTMATVDIVDSSTNSVTITASDPIAAETTVEEIANPGAFTFTRSKVTSTPLTVLFTLGGTAKEGLTVNDDYAPLPVSGIYRVATIPAFEASTTVAITPRDDLQIEGTETVIATLQPNGTEYTLGTPQEAAVQIIDNDRPVLQLLEDDKVAVEAPVPTNLGSFILKRSPVSDIPLLVTLDFGGTQILGTNYSLSYVDGSGQTIILNDPLSSNIVEIPAGAESVKVTLTPTDDHIYQATKTVDISMRPSTAYDFSFGFLTSTRINIVEDDLFPDTKVPTVTLTTPKNGTRFLIGQDVTFAGSAVDTAGAAHTPGVDKVLYRINHHDWKLITQLDPATPAASVTWGPPAGAPIVLPVNAPMGPTDGLEAGFNTIDVQSFDIDGNPSKIATSIIKRVQLRTLTVNVGGTGSGAVTGNQGTYEVGDTVKLTATAQTGSIFGGWTGAPALTPRIYTFVMPDSDVTLTANFNPNPFVPETAGVYTGLMQGAQFNLETSGYMSVTVGPTGLATGKLITGGITYPFKGEFLGDGTLQVVLPRKNTTALTVKLAADLNPAGTREITGTVESSSFTAALVLDRSHYSTKTNPAPPSIAKSYTILMPPANPIGDTSKDPRGFGIGKVKIGADGVVHYTGTLPDGTKASFNQALSKNNTWPLFLSLYKKKGVLLGNIAIDTTQTTSDMNGTFDWFKPVVVKDLFFPLGFKVQDGNFFASIYTAPATGTPALDGFASSGTNAKVLLQEGSLLASITKDAIFLLNKVTIPAPAETKLTVKINAATGDMTGSFVHPVSDKVVKFTGILFQKRGEGYAFLPGSSVSGVNPQTGKVTLTKP